MNAPERISVLIRNGAVHLPNGSGWKPHDFTEYLLNTPEALAAAPEVQRLIAEAVTRERRACAKLAETTPINPMTDSLAEAIGKTARQNVWACAADHHGYVVAAAIRNRKETT